VICSKNVSLFALTPKDLEVYTDRRYERVLKVAQIWLAMVDEFDRETLIELKRTLDGFTILGYFCGDPKEESLIKYKIPYLCWYGIVLNDNEGFCLDPFEARDKLARLGLEFVCI
jgi:hypothetical protein